MLESISDLKSFEHNATPAILSIRNQSTTPLFYPQQSTDTAALNCGSNPLTAAAANLLAIAGRIQLNPHLELTELLRQLIQEVMLFEQRVQKLNYHIETSKFASYIVCASLDEIIIQTKLAQEQELTESALLLQNFHQESWAGEKFFLLLERLCLEPGVYIDLLELIYLCLTLGFMGKFRNLGNGTALLTDIKDQLYQQIRRQRGAIRKSLLIESDIAPMQALTYQSNSLKNKSYKICLGVIFGSALSLLIGFNYYVNQTWLPAYQHLSEVIANG
jgi:type VI secretion system protein ImpK